LLNFSTFKKDNHQYQSELHTNYYKPVKMIDNPVSYVNPTPQTNQANLPSYTNQSNPLLMAQQPNITPPEAANTTFNNNNYTNPFNYFINKN